MFETIFMNFFLTFVFVFPAYIISSSITSSPKRNKAAVEKAIARGNVIHATFIKSGPAVWDVPGVQSPGPHHLCVYHYTYKGRKYKFRAWLGNNPPQSVTLYFLNNPRKATFDVALCDSEIYWPLVYLIVFLFLTNLLWGFCGLLFYKFIKKY